MPNTSLKNIRKWVELAYIPLTTPRSREAGAMKLAVHHATIGSLLAGVITSLAIPFSANATTPTRVDPPYGSCKEAHADGAYNIKRGDPGYRPKLDRDNDGVACEG
ncbi:excalibur calcium-binding domain-containing protein [Mycobacteroides abscessus]